MNLDDLAGLIGEQNVKPEAVQDEPEAGWAPPPLVPGSVAAAVVADVYGGAAVTIVKSPPGGGKTHLLGILTAWLAGFGDLRVGVATFTTEQRNAVAERLALDLPDGMVRLEGRSNVPDGLKHLTKPMPSVPGTKVSVMTCASLTARGSAPQFDVLLIDEAYQLPFDEVATAAANTPQLVLVGDPGQIGPVITADTSAWEAMRVAPHRRAPEAFEHLYGVTPKVHTMDATWRLGEISAKVIAPLYDFPFGSTRPDKYVARGGARLPEVAHFTVPEPGGVDDSAMMRAVVDLAVSHLGDSLVEDGQQRTVVESDIAIVVSRSTQVTKITAMLRAGGRSRISVGTADKLQGGQWAVVVALDPITGAPDLGSHQISLGRTCVMLSRHKARLVWVHDSSSVAQLVKIGAERAAVAVRQRILSQPIA